MENLSLVAPGHWLLGSLLLVLVLALALASLLGEPWLLAAPGSGAAGPGACLPVLEKEKPAPASCLRALLHCKAGLQSPCDAAWRRCSIFQCEPLC